MIAQASILMLIICNFHRLQAIEQFTTLKNFRSIASKLRSAQIFSTGSDLANLTLVDHCFQQRLSLLANITKANHCFFSSDLAVSEPGNSKKQRFSNSDPWKQISDLAISERGKKQRVPSSGNPSCETVRSAVFLISF